MIPSTRTTLSLTKNALLTGPAESSVVEAYLEVLASKRRQGACGSAVLCEGAVGAVFDRLVTLKPNRRDQATAVSAWQDLEKFEGRRTAR